MLFDGQHALYMLVSRVWSLTRLTVLTVFRVKKRIDLLDPGIRHCHCRERPKISYVTC